MIRKTTGAILLAAGANGWLYGVTQTGGDGMVVIDKFRLFANWIFLLAGALSILISYLARRTRPLTSIIIAVGVTVASFMVYLAGASGWVVVADGSAEAAERLQRVLTTDPGTGVMRHGDAGYERLRTPHRERYACADCSERKERERQVEGGTPDGS